MSRKRTASTSSSDQNIPQKKSKFNLKNIELTLPQKHGEVLVTGSGDLGQLGLGSNVLEKSRPMLLKLNYEIVDICAGGMHTVLLTNEGKVVTFGCNDEGALGRDTADDEEAEFTPNLVDLPEKAVQISAGDSHTAVLLESGKVYAWGTFRDSHGNMGMTIEGNQKLPYLLSGKRNIIKIASGADHIAFLTNFGEVYTCGCAEQGQLGRVSGRACDRNSRQGRAKLLEPMLIFLKPSRKLHFDDIWAGTYATFAKVYNKNDIYVFGLNNYRQIGLKLEAPQFNPTLSKEFSKYEWQLICSAQHHTIALDKDGRTFAIGRKEYGRLGLGENCDDAIELTEIPALKGKKVVHIGSGSATSFAVTNDGLLYGWGMGTAGQLGTGEEDDRFEPTLIKSKQLENRQVFKVTSGGQHTVMLAISKNNNQGDLK